MLFTLRTSNSFKCCPREGVVDSSRKGRTLSPHTSANVNVVVAVKNRNRRKTRRGEEALKLECSRCVFNHHHHRMGGVFAGASSSSFTSLASSSGRNEDDESDEKEEEEEEEGNSSSSSSSSSDSDKSSKEENKQQEKDILVQLSLSLIDFYRNELSPFMPKSCRFIPSCSNYAFEAYTKYGAAKGFILTAWRIARCNPFGGRGYDPPRWPPSFTRGGDGE
jgi:putative membrane protein insertion efficiency factor